MTIDYHITVGAILSQSETARLTQIITETFAHVDQIYNCWNPESELSRLNRLEAERAVPLSPELEQFLQKTGEMVALSEGRFDPTIHSLQTLWKSSLEVGRTPSQEEIAALRPSLGWSLIHFSNGYFWKEHQSTSLDLGGIAKGHCVDLLTEHLLAAGYPNLFVEWGGEIRTAGEHPTGRPWHLFISRLEDTDPAHAIAHLDLTDHAIATSGDYFQHWEAAGERFFHIFNPQSGSPMLQKRSGIASASVAAPSCALADGLATTAMLFSSVEEAERWAKKIQEIYPNVQFWFVSHES